MKVEEEEESEELLPKAAQHMNSSTALHSVSSLSIAKMIEFVVSIKFLVLLALCISNAANALITRYSKAVLHEVYSPTEVVIVSELMKLTFSMIAVVYTTNVDSDDTSSSSSSSRSNTIIAVSRRLQHFLSLILTGRHMVVLVLLYSISNILSIYALTHIEASIYSVLSNLKILSTAAFAAIMLGRYISYVKWRALILMLLGCVLVASPLFDSDKCSDVIAAADRISNSHRYLRFPTSNVSTVSSATIPSYSSHNQENSVFGIGAILIMVAISGYASIYFEKILKNQSALSPKASVWELNFQLSFYSLVLLLSLTLFEHSVSTSADSSVGNKYHIFDGWSIVTFLTALSSAMNGLVVALTLKHADSILKTLASTGSIILSTFVGWLLLQGSMTIFVVIGSFCTVLGIFNYTLDS